MMIDGFRLEHERDSTFFQPDTLLATEYFEVFRTKHWRDPEVRLMAAVLEDAIHCYVKHLPAVSRKGRRLFSEVNEWFFAADDGWLFSFENVCETIGVDAGYIRRGLTRVRESLALKGIGLIHLGSKPALRSAMKASYPGPSARKSKPGRRGRSGSDKACRMTGDAVAQMH
jgi:hypothetical protein